MSNVNIVQLPAEVIDKILNFLELSTHLEVHKVFFGESRTIARKEIRVGLCNSDVAETFLKTSFNNQLVTTVNLSGCCIVDCNLLKNFVQKCINLRRLNVTNSAITCETISEITANMTKLTHLWISIGRETYTVNLPGTVQRTLQFLYLGMPQLSIINIPKTFVQLQKLHLFQNCSPLFCSAVSTNNFLRLCPAQQKDSIGSEAVIKEFNSCGLEVEVQSLPTTFRMSFGNNNVVYSTEEHLKILFVHCSPEEAVCDIPRATCLDIVAYEIYDFRSIITMFLIDLKISACLGHYSASLLAHLAKIQSLKRLSVADCLLSNSDKTSPLVSVEELHLRPCHDCIISNVALNVDSVVPNLLHLVLKKGCTLEPTRLSTLHTFETELGGVKEIEMCRKFLRNIYCSLKVFIVHDLFERSTYLTRLHREQTENNFWTWLLEFPNLLYACVRGFNDSLSLKFLKSYKDSLQKHQHSMIRIHVHIKAAIEGLQQRLMFWLGEQSSPFVFIDACNGEVLFPKAAVNDQLCQHSSYLCKKKPASYGELHFL